MGKGIQVILLLIFLWGCKAEKVTMPAYVQIDDYTTKVMSDGSQGTSNQKFTDMLVFANGQSCGTFPVGKPIPVIVNGPTKILIRGVIEINGVSAVRADYEVMAGCDTTITVTTGVITKIKPVFKYFTGVVFHWYDNFNTGIIGIGGTDGIQAIPIKATSQDTTCGLYTPGIDGGNDKCLALRPTETITTSSALAQTFHLLGNGVGVYMELNYYSNVAVSLSMQGGATNAILDLGGIYPSPSGWNKVYLDLTEQVSNLKGGAFTITISAVYDSNVGTNFAFLDNIKVVSKQ